MPPSDPPPSDPVVALVTNAAPVPRELVLACCEEVGLDPERDYDEVLEAVSDPPYRECCESGCDPCVLSIVRAAALVRQRHAG